MNVAKKDWRERFDEIFGEVSKKDAELVDMLEPCPHMPCSGAVKDFIAAEIAAAEDRVREQYKPLVEAVKNKFLGNPCIYCIDNDDPTCNCADKQLYTAYISLERSNENG